MRVTINTYLYALGARDPEAATPREQRAPSVPRPGSLNAVPPAEGTGAAGDMSESGIRAGRTSVVHRVVRKVRTCSNNSGLTDTRTLSPETHNGAGS